MDFYYAQFYQIKLIPSMKYISIAILTMQKTQNYLNTLNNTYIRYFGIFKVVIGIKVILRYT